MAASFTADGGTARVGEPRELFRGDYFAPIPGGSRRYHIAPDGRFLMLKGVAGGNAGDVPPPQVVLVQNFFEELKAVAPE